MKRILIDYKKLDKEVAALLLETYPSGYGDEDIIRFKNGAGEYIEAVELRTSDVLYLVKISKSLSNFIANFDDSIEKELEGPQYDNHENEEAELELDGHQEFEDDPEYDLDYD